DVTPYAGQGTYVSVAAPAQNASENGPTPRSFVVTRAGGDLSKPLTLSYLVGGTATNGVDYAAISGAIVIPANATSISVTVTPVDDPIAEATETVTLTLFATSDYAIGNVSSATIRINDNDTPVGNTITWTSKAPNPIIRAE